MSRPSFSNEYPAAGSCTRRWPRRGRPVSAAGLLVPAPQAAFYLYPDFAPWREHLRTTRGISNGADLATHLLHCYGMGVLPASAFGEAPEALRMRVATAMLYGETDVQRERALLSNDPVNTALDRGGAGPDRRRTVRHRPVARPDGMQHLLAGAAWDADAVRDDVRAYVSEHSGAPGRVITTAARSAARRRQHGNRLRVAANDLELPDDPWLDAIRNRGLSVFSGMIALSSSAPEAGNGLIASVRGQLWMVSTGPALVKSRAISS